MGRPMKYLSLCGGLLFCLWALYCPTAQGLPNPCVNALVWAVSGGFLGPPRVFAGISFPTDFLWYRVVPITASGDGELPWGGYAVVFMSRNRFQVDLFLDDDSANRRFGVKEQAQLQEAVPALKIDPLATEASDPSGPTANESVRGVSLVLLRNLFESRKEFIAASRSVLEKLVAVSP